MLGNTDHTLDNSFSSARRSLGAAPVTPGIRHSGKSRRKLPPLSSQILEELHLAYIGNRFEVSANLDRISTRAEIPKWVLKYEARKRGWRCVTSSRPWLPQEVRHLKEKLGCDSGRRIARDLNRTWLSVQVKAEELKLLDRVSQGYNIADLCECFGLHQARIERWARRGLLGKPERHGDDSGDLRFTTSQVVRFARRHPHEYDLCRVNEAWFKALVLGNPDEEEERLKTLVFGGAAPGPTLGRGAQA